MTKLQALKSVFIALVCCVAMAAAAQAQTVVGRFTADNYFAVFQGNANGATNFITWLDCSTSASCIANGKTFSIPNVKNGDYVYIVAWSDLAAAQGLLGTLSGFVLDQGCGSSETGAAGWEVYANGAAFSGKPGSISFLADLNTSIVKANNGINGTWGAPAVGTANIGSGGSVPVTVTGYTGTAKWVWHNSGNCIGTMQPFQDGCNHNEYLVFRFPVNSLFAACPLPVQRPCCDIARTAVTVSQNDIAFDSANSAVVSANFLSLQSNVKEVKVTLLSVWESFAPDACRTSGPIDAYLTNAYSNVAFGGSVPQAFGNEGVWNSLNPAGAPPNGVFKYRLNLPTAATYPCAGQLSFCVKYTVTTTDCKSCEIIRCYTSKPRTYRKCDPTNPASAACADVQYN